MLKFFNTVGPLFSQGPECRPLYARSPKAILQQFVAALYNYQETAT